MSSLKSVKRFDYGQINAIEKTPQGFLKIPGAVTRTGVFTYRDPSGKVRRELRHPDDVLDPKSLSTLKNAVVTLEHPPVMVTAENFKQYAVGYTTDRVEVNRDLIEGDLIIANQAAIDAIENGKRELSAGYIADLEEKPGVYDGNDYDVRQRNIVYNHVAVVEKGRAGPEVRLRLDSDDAVMIDEEQGHMQNDSVEEILKTQQPWKPAPKEKGVGPVAEILGKQAKPKKDAEGDEPGQTSEQTRKVAIGGQEVEMPVAAAEIVEAMFDRYDQLRGELAKTQEESMPIEKQTDKKDVDISQKGISPQVPVEQMAKDGKSAGAKSDAEGTLPGGVAPKKDAGMLPPSQSAGPSASPAGVAAGAPQQALSPADALKSELESHKSAMGEMQAKHDAEKQEMQAKHDEMAAKMDEMASATMNPKVGEGKMDSADITTRIRARAKLERQAAAICTPQTVAKFDSMSDDEIRREAIKTVRPSFDTASPQAKQTTYLQVRFDSIIEDGETSGSVRREMGGAVARGHRMDAGQELDPKSKRAEMIAAAKELHKTPSSAVKK